jgi:hypothetical protein
MSFLGCLVVVSTGESSLERSSRAEPYRDAVADSTPHSLLYRLLDVPRRRRQAFRACLFTPTVRILIDGCGYLETQPASDYTIRRAMTRPHASGNPRADGYGLSLKAIRTR